MKTNQILYDMLAKYFNYNHFREGQKEIIVDILAGKDVLGILRTGIGKSLCYQLPSIILPGTTIVVSPLISLMLDQVRQIKANYFKEVVALHSFQSRHERSTVLRHLSQYKLIYISPELLQQASIISILKNMKISLFVIDEAHCISQWGYDFRPDYLRLKWALQQLGNPLILALTGTATPEVQKDIMEKLDRPKMKLHIYPMDRENISLVVQQVIGDEEEKINQLVHFLSNYNQSTIIYFSSRKGTERIASLLTSQLPNRRIAYYHGGMDTMDRLKIQQQFMNNQLDIVCSTSAFGMGINKKDIRFIIHYHVPTQIESFIQEIGRAGRDGNESLSLLLYRPGDEQIPLQIIENELPNEKELKFVLNQLYVLFSRNEKLPVDEEEITNMFRLTVTKWRFLLYQFEIHGMIKNNKINYHPTIWNFAMQQINNFCLKRLEIKRQKLMEVIEYVNTKDCLRLQLYKKFHQPIRKKEKQCCSNCGFYVSKWMVEEVINSKKEEKKKWQEKLASLLSIGE